MTAGRQTGCPADALFRRRLPRSTRGRLNERAGISRIWPCVAGLINLAAADGVIALNEKRIAGLLTYATGDDTREILSPEAGGAGNRYGFV